MERERQLRDPRELTAVAHPVRLGILEQLTLHGPLTATELADRLDETPANCSWHLRKLAEHAFVEEAPREGGRRRPWQMSQLGLSWGDEDAEPEEQRAGDALAQMLLERWISRYAASVAVDREAAPEWRRARSVNQTVTWLTPTEAEEVHEHLRAVLERYRDRIEDASQRPEGSRMVELVTFGGPIDGVTR